MHFVGFFKKIHRIQLILYMYTHFETIERVETNFKSLDITWKLMTKLQTVDTSLFIMKISLKVNKHILLMHRDIRCVIHYSNKQQISWIEPQYDVQSFYILISYYCMLTIWQWMCALDLKSMTFLSQFHYSSILRNI